ncbi:MAG: alpha/beta hydrolase [Anaerolineae bacterium]|nr:alpha/beta hydrolase [Anaerolineae bacterium]
MNTGVVKVNSDGLELVAESFGQGQPLVAAHGLSGNRHVTRQQFRSLADHYRIIVYDQRGHNDSSPVTNPSLYNADRMAEDMRAVMDAYHIEKAIVQGESMGAATTLLFTLKYPHRVSALLLTGPAFSDAPNPEIPSLHQMASEIEHYGLKEYLRLSAERMRANWGAPEEVIEAVQFMQGCHQERSLITALETVKDWIIFNDLSEIAQLTMPVCMIAWPNDPLHPIELAQRMCDYLPHAKLETIPSVGHVFLNHGAILGDIYARFLAELASTP